MIRAIGIALLLSLAAFALFWLVPASDPVALRRGVVAPENLVAQALPTSSVQEAATRIESRNFWGTVQPAVEEARLTGKIVGAVRTFNDRFVLVQIDKQTALQLRVGDPVPKQIGPFAGGTIVDIHAERITIVKNGETYFLPVIN